MGRLGRSYASNVVTVGANSFLGVEFPLVVGNRYVRIGRDPSGGSTPEVRVLRWEAETRAVREEPEVGSSAALTWDHDAELGAVRLRINPQKASGISGYLAGGPLDSMVIIVSPDVIRVMVAGELMSEFAGNVLMGSDIGLRIDPGTGDVGLGGKLPEGFEYRLRYESETIRISSMVDADSPLLRRREFIDCRIEGPALLAPAGPFGLDSNRIGAPGLDSGSVVWEIPPTGQAFGAILVSDVVFTGCDLVAVAFAVSPGERAKFLHQLFGR